MVATSKVPMLKLGEYEIWRMRIKQYIHMIDYALWEVIKNGATLLKTQVMEGVMTEMPITSAEEKAQRSLKVKAKSNLMMGILNEHQLKFNAIKDTKELLEAVEKRFGGNVATKKTQRNLLKQQYENFNASSSEMLDQTFDRLQKLMSQLELLGEKLSQEYVQKLLRSLSPEWNTHVDAEAVNTACYVQNRVLVVKPHNKTPYELFHDRKPTLSFMRPSGCLVTILNTIDHLGKFDGKADEGFFVGYPLNSKAFRVFNSRTRIVEENLHIRFSENTPNDVGSGPDWLFDIDALTRTINYEPIVAGTQSNGFADQEKEDNVDSTNNVNTVSLNVNATSTNEDNELPFDLNMPALEDVSIFNFPSDNEDDVAVADMNNLDTTSKGKNDKTLFIKRHKGDILLVQVYVDDIIFGLTKKELCNAFERLMHEKFQMSFMGELTFFLRLQKFGFIEVKTASTPMETQKPLLKDEDGEEVYQVNQKISHLHAVKRIFRYLKGQLELGLWYLKDSPFDLVAYNDSDYDRASLDRKFTIGGCQFLGCRLISWQCKKLTVVANSKTEAEYSELGEGSVMPTDIHHTPTILQSSTSQPQKTHKPRKRTRKVTQVPQPGNPMEHVADKAVHKELGDSLVRAATTASSLEAEQDSGNINKTQSKTTPNEPSSQ
nr:ribonuclease H-like domain-containing protein [Tanacetum cinerariifolium]